MIPNLSNGSVKPQNNYDDSFNNIYLAAKSVDANLTALSTRLSSIYVIVRTNQIYQSNSDISITPESTQTIKSIELLNYYLDKFNQTELDIIATAVEKTLKNTNLIQIEMKTMLDQLKSLLLMLKYTNDDLQLFNNIFRSSITRYMLKAINNTDFIFAMSILPSSFSRTLQAFQSINASFDNKNMFLINISNVVSIINSRTLVGRFIARNSSLSSLYDELMKINNTFHAYNQLNSYIDYYQNYLNARFIDYQYDLYLAESCNTSIYPPAKTMSILVTELYTTSFSLNAPLISIMSLINETNLTVISEKVFTIKHSLNVTQDAIVKSLNNIDIIKTTTLREILQKMNETIELLRIGLIISLNKSVNSTFLNFWYNYPLISLVSISSIDQDNIAKTEKILFAHSFFQSFFAAYPNNFYNISVDFISSNSNQTSNFIKAVNNVTIYINFLRK
jgi:hypothetical protein